ncbi:uncharacterized protein M6B38_333165 [Iris pallida]|uniref:NHL repeat-containing protein n=2 Tax=Iris pallida TaxID=29817 RepID=A0AAX6H212_IRIPA|nr:uncharacterized protein M6B38_333165 [Iris pallida]
MAEKKLFPLLLLLLLLISLNGISAASAASPAKIVGGVFSNAASHVLKRLWAITSAPKAASTARPQMKFESGYTVETVFDGSKLGIEPFSAEVAPGGDLLVLDSVNSNMYRIPLPLSRYSRPKLVAGSAEGYAGHVDGRVREARMNHPKGFAVDDRGNIYVADAANMAIRKISDTGVTTIAGGKWNRGGYLDGPSEDVKLSNDFEVVYIASSCSLLVVDRGNQAIREIQLNFDDCAYQYGTGFPLGIAVLLAAGFFGYMLALLQRRVGGIVSSNDELITPTKATIPPSPYQKPLKSSLRPPLIPNEDEPENQEEEGLFTSINKLFTGAISSIAAIPAAVFSGFRKKPKINQQQQQQNYYYHYNQQQRRTNTWPMQESFEIPAEDEPPPPVETRTPTPRKTYAFMTKDPEKIHQLRQGRAFLNGWEAGEQQHQLQQHHAHQQHLQQHRQQPLGPQTYYEQSCESTNEIVFGAVQESDGSRRTVEIKAVNYGEPVYDLYGVRSRVHYSSYNNGY